MSDSPLPVAIPARRSRLAFIAPLFGILIVLCLAILIAAPRVPAVWSFRQMPDGIRNSEGRSVASEYSKPEPHVFFPDPDDYTRVYRAKKIADGDVKRWGVMKEIDAPSGVELHWTAPMDYLVAGAGYWGERLFGRRDGFATGAALLPLVLGLVYLICLMGLTKQLSNWAAAILCGALCAVSPSFHRVFELGHADHHCLLECLVVASLLLLSLGMKQVFLPDRKVSYKPQLFMSGIAMGVCIWTASLALFFWGVIFAALLISIALSTVGTRRNIANAATTWNFGVFLAIVTPYVWDSWDDLNTATIDRISGFHFGVLFISQSLISWIGGRVEGATLKFRKKVNFLLLPAALMIIVLALKSDSFLEYVKGEQLARWHALVAELQPLLTIQSTHGHNSVASYISFEPLHARLGFTLYLLPLALPFFAMASRIPPPVRWIIGLSAVLVAALSLFQLRWIDHYSTFVLPVIAVGLYEAIDRLAKAAPRLKLTPQFRAGLAFTVLAATSIPFMTWARLGLLASANAAASTDPNLTDPSTQALLRGLAPREDQIRTDFVARAINKDIIRLRESDNRRNILCEEGEGPTLLYETGLPVVAAPYHRAIGGIVSMMEFFAERDPLKARAMLDKLQVRYIVVPYHVNEQLMNFEQVAFGRLRSFDPPDESFDALGRLVRKLHYKPEVTQTMAYRLAIRPRDHGIPNVEVLYTICDDPGRPQDAHGLLFVVKEPSPTSTSAPNPQE